MENAITIDYLNYHNLWDGLTMSIKSNSITAISGPNNCGKTTLIRILNREIIVENDIEIFKYPLNCYTIDEFEKYVACVIPLEHIPLEDTIEEEMYLIQNNKKEIDWIIKELKMKKIINKPIKELSDKEFVFYQIATALMKGPNLLLMDCIDSVLSEEECQNVLEFLKEVQRTRNLTVVFTTRNLKTALLSDYLFIIDERKVKLKGLPMEVLEKDNIVNKCGLDLPFIIDLSVKLKDYELIKDIETDQERILDELWKLQ